MNSSMTVTFEEEEEEKKLVYRCISRTWFTIIYNNQETQDCPLWI